MDILKIEATRSTPEILFDKKNNLLEVKGKSYPPDIGYYYNPLLVQVQEYLARMEDQLFTVNIELVYFNSSSSKLLMDFFDMLDEAAGRGKNIAVNWIFHEDDEDSMEFGEEFKDDIESLTFNLVKKVEI
ncbi:MAG: DUF1987 domain-containing protein [Desulfobacterales bacterium]|nr:DUF1987 domain-containing protein [Desulfobacterales bacterium]